MQIQHDPKQQRFFADIDGNIARLDYVTLDDGKTLDYRHTFVPEALRGQQIGVKLAQFALDYAKQNHLKVIATCPFIKRIIELYPEYKNIEA